MSVMMTKRKADAIKSAERDEIYIGEEAAMARVMEAESPGGPRTIPAIEARTRFRWI